MRSILRLIADTRYLILIPVAGLFILAATLFIAGGFSLLRFVASMILGAETVADQIIVEIVEFVHFFLIGTVLYITGMGLFQLFVKPLNLPAWLKIEDIEELELNLVGVVIVVIGVNFLRIIIDPGDINLLNYGVGYALPIIGLSYFIFVRSRNQAKDPIGSEDDADLTRAAEPDAQPSPDR